MANESVPPSRTDGALRNDGQTRTEGHAEGHAGEHESFIKTPKQLITVVVLSFLVPILFIMLLAHFVAAGKREGAGADAMTAEAIDQRIRPVAGFELKSAANAATARSGEAVVTAVCGACHTSGAAGAPKVGDAAAWAPRLAQGRDALIQSAMKGKGAMPPQAGGDTTDLEVARAVVFMANKGGAQFDEPAAAAPAASSEAAASAAAAPAPVPASTPAASATPAASDKAATAAASAGAAVAAATSARTAAPATAAASDVDLDKGKALYDTTCMSCHTAGVAGAPKLGDKASWAERASRGLDELTKSAIQGKNAMPPKGLAATASEADIRNVVAYMLKSVE